MKRRNWVLMAAAVLCAGMTFQGAFAEDVKPALPVIPDKTFNLKDYGGVGDGRTFNTDAFTKAIAAVQAAGGGHLIVPAGTFLTRSFTLTSHMDLHLERGATIKAPSTYADYGLADPMASLGVAGGGVRGVDAGAGADVEGAAAERLAPGPRAQHRLRMRRAEVVSQRLRRMRLLLQHHRRRLPRPLDEAAEGAGAVVGGGRGQALINGRNLSDISITGSGTIDGSGAMFWVLSSSASLRYLRGLPSYGRPVLVALGGDRMLFDGVTLQNSPMFHLTPSGNDITISNLRIFAPCDTPNTDAMDIRGDRIVVRNCEIDVGDDNVEIGGPCHHLLVENITCLHGHGISIGSPTGNGGVGQVMVRNCTFDGGENAIRIKSARGRGGLIQDVTYQDITIKNIEKRPIDIDMLYSGARPVVPGARNIPELKNILIKNVTITRSPQMGRIIGLPEQLAKEVTLENVKVEADSGILVQDAKDIVFKNVQIDAAVGDPITLDNANVIRQP